MVTIGSLWLAIILSAVIVVDRERVGVDGASTPQV